MTCCWTDIKDSKRKTKIFSEILYYYKVKTMKLYNKTVPTVKKYQR